MTTLTDHHGISTPLLTIRALLPLLLRFLVLASWFVLIILLRFWLSESPLCLIRSDVEVCQVFVFGSVSEASLALLVRTGGKRNNLNLVICYSVLITEFPCKLLLDLPTYLDLDFLKIVGVRFPLAFPVSGIKL